MENTSSPTTESDNSEFQANDDYKINEINDFSDWDAATDDTDANIRETIKIQATEVVGSVLNDLEVELVPSKPIESKVKFVMTKTMEAGTSRNETKIAKKHKGKL